MNPKKLNGKLNILMIFYNLFISIISLSLRLLSLFNTKAKQGIQGRKESLNIIKEKIKDKRVIWMHSASLGEYEQGLPVLEKLKQKYPEYKILVSFFSPSGYENVIKKKTIADAICYLPFDDKKNIQKFVSQFKTEIFFTVKYDFWYNLLAELKKQGAKTYVVSALFYEKQIFFKPFGSWFVKQLKENIDWFFHQTEHSEKLAKSIGLTQSSTSGDTRFDRVKQNRKRENFIPFIEDFKKEKILITFGSSWEAEERISKKLSTKLPNVKIIIAPHDLKRVYHLKKDLPNAILYSELKENNTLNSILLSNQVLIIDSIGLLSKIYSYTDIAVVGGGFHSAGLHNILEAATFGKPVIFGNHYKKNPEADSLISHNGGKAFSTEKEATDFISNLIESEALRKEMSKNSEEFIQKQPNASDIILKTI